jgi:hypothetical protein
VRATEQPLVGADEVSRRAGILIAKEDDVTPGEVECCAWCIDAARAEGWTWKRLRVLHFVFHRPL